MSFAARHPVIRQDRSWIELLHRLPGVGLLRADSATRARIVREAAPSD
jgi:hypothetical protein